jgi:hypothetical protein
MIDWIVVFAGMFALDFVFALYTMYVQEKQPVMAAHFATAIFLLQAVVIASYVKDFSLILPAAAGAWLGTWAAVRRGS